MSLFLVRRTARLTVVTATLLSIVAVGRVPAFASAATFYAAPTATGAANCSSPANACTLSTAIGDTAGGDTVILADGTYTSTPVTISDGITLIAASGATPTLDGRGIPDDVIDVTSADQVTLNGLTAQNAGPISADVSNTGSVKLIGTTLNDGGYGLYNSGTAVVTDSTISDNTGSGIVATATGTTTVTRTTVSGATYGLNGINATLTTTVLDSTFTGNQTGITTGGTTTITDSLVTGSGDGIETGGTTTVTGSTISDNAGAAVAATGTTTVSGSTLSANNQGIASNGTTTVTDSTLTGNNIGVDTEGGTTTITGATVAGNSFDGMRALGGAIDSGANIVASNDNQDCEIGPGSLTDEGDDIDGDGTCGFSAAGSISGSASIAGSLLPLADHGGPSRTIALKPSSPAIELVTGSLLDGSKVCGTPDQRGYTRPSAPCDAGAFETNPRLATPTLDLSVAPAGGSGLGQSVTLTGFVTGSAGDPTGTIRFTADGAPIAGCGSDAISSGLVECTTSGLAAGSYDLRAHYSGDTDYASATDTVSPYPVAKGQTSTTVTVTPSSLSATISPVAPATAITTGTVTFSVDGSPVGSAPVSGSAATLSHVSSGAHTVSATYHGSSQYESSVGSTATTNPTITSHLTSAHPRTSYGWYRSPVTVTFVCTPGSSALTGACPSPVTVSRNGPRQTVSKTITATDGGTASLTVSPINIDKLSPTVKVVGVKSGHTYRKAPHPTCTATSLSGIAGGCVVTTKSAKHGKTIKVSYTATATNKAGSSTTVKGSYTIKK